jgi:hypothetical protein
MADPHAATPAEMSGADILVESLNWHYKRQAERYKSAAFDSPLP